MILLSSSKAIIAVTLIGVLLLSVLDLSNAKESKGDAKKIKKAKSAKKDAVKKGIAAKEEEIDSSEESEDIMNFIYDLDDDDADEGTESTETIMYVDMDAGSEQQGRIFRPVKVSGLDRGRAFDWSQYNLNLDAGNLPLPKTKTKIPFSDMNMKNNQNMQNQNNNPNKRNQNNQNPQNQNKGNAQNQNTPQTQTLNNGNSGNSSPNQVCGTPDPVDDQVCISVKLPWKIDPVYFCTPKTSIQIKECSNAETTDTCFDDGRNDTLKIATPWDCCPHISIPNTCDMIQCPPEPFNRTCKAVKKEGDCCKTYYCDKEEPTVCKSLKAKASCTEPPKGKENCTQFRDPYGCCTKFQCDYEERPGYCPKPSIAVKMVTKMAVNSEGKQIALLVPEKSVSSSTDIRCIGDSFCPADQKCCSLTGPVNKPRTGDDTKPKKRLLDGFCRSPVFAEAESLPQGRRFKSHKKGMKGRKFSGRSLSTSGRLFSGRSLQGRSSSKQGRSFSGRSSPRGRSFHG